MFRELLFWACAVACLYVVVGYPLVLRVAVHFRNKRINVSPFTPKVSVLIAAYNEVACIENTIRNKLDQEYPADKLEVIVVSDDSEDGTDAVVQSIQAPNVSLLRQSPRSGKAAALNLGVRHASGEILVFSDANTVFAKDTVSRLVESLSDPTVGYVTGRLEYRHAGHGLSAEGCAGYMEKENELRLLETQFGSVIGVNGGVDAIRRTLYRDVPADQITDFVLPLTVIESGLRVVFEPRALAFEEPNDAVADEFKMRVRVTVRALRGLWLKRRVLNPRVVGVRTVFSIISHKLLRYAMPVFLLGALISSGTLAVDVALYRLLFTGQCLLYGIGLLGFMMPRGRRGRLVKTGSYLLMTNAAFIVAIVKLIRGERIAVWKPRAG